MKSLSVKLFNYVPFAFESTFVLIGKSGKFWEADVDVLYGVFNLIKLYLH